MRTLRNIFRRKLRAFLTIFGISIGVFSLVVMGALAEKLTLLVDGGTTYYVGKVVVYASGGIAGYSTEPLTTNMRREIEKVPGVARVAGSVSGLLSTEQSSISFGSPGSYQATDGRERGYESYVVNVAEGRDIQPTDSGKVVIGADLVKKYDAQIGSTIEIRDKKFEVVGIYEKTLTAPDNSLAIGLKDAQALAAEDLSPSMRDTVNPDTIVSSFVVYPEPGTTTDQLKARIERRMNTVKAMSPADFEQQIKQPLEIFSSIIYAVAAISLLVGGLSVINTMTMSVSERTREIGVRKAIGASDLQIMVQFISESAIIGLIGGTIGILLGLMVTSAGNAAGEASGSALFLVSNRLLLGSLGFAVGLGTVSGLYPAWHASQLNPVQALRYE
ncbi:MAG: ABC transporter permease [Coriobacteriia bacterium]|nr:ABC transporter permease [Coriobacteriia bacterium]